jgi:hypothetical protein
MFQPGRATTAVPPLPDVTVTTITLVYRESNTGQHL